MKAFYVFLVCVILAGCSFAAQQPPTVTATLSPTDTPTPNLTATYEVNRAATQTMSMGTSYAVATQRGEPTITAIARAAFLLDEIKNATDGIGDMDLEGAILNLGPLDGQIKDAPGNFVALHNTQLAVFNFIVSITFINPQDTATEGKWDYGLFFRQEDANKQYRLVILSNQSWTLFRSDAGISYIYSSNDKNLTAKVGEENMIWLIVIDKKAHLFLNGIHAKTMDLGDGPSRGGLFPATGIYYGNASIASSTQFRDFTVWQLP